MATLLSQRDLVATFKQETILTVRLLSKLHTMSAELSKDVFKENALEKPTQNLFNHLSYYLISIIDVQAAGGLAWPLYDTKTERAFRNALSSIILEYSNKGELSPVMSSYLVNPSCYKVTLLLFQMSQLALQRTLLSKMSKESQKNLYNNMTVMYKSKNNESFMENIENATVTISSKFSNYMHKKEKIEKIAEVMRKKITEMESKLSTIAAQEYINDLVDGFLNKHELDETTKTEILNIKNIYKPAKFFDAWLSDFDQKILEIQNKWDQKTSSYMKLALDTQCCTETLIARQTGEADKTTYILEFNSKTDDICTKDLQCEVNSEQKYILKNIVRNNQLNFPNLIRGFLVAISFIQNNAEHSDEIYKFNEHLREGRRQYSEMVLAMKNLLDRLKKAEAKLLPRQLLYSQARGLKDFMEIPPLPDLSDLKMGKDLQTQNLSLAFTPLNISKHQFNLQRKSKSMFAKPQSRPLLVAPFYQGPRDDFLKSLNSCRMSSYNHMNITQKLNLSKSQTTFMCNETIAGCSSGFTKQQIMRLLSTKKSSSSKKFSYKTERPTNTNIKKGGLFNESHISTDSGGLTRSYSSPNLYENPVKRSITGRKLSLMQEDYPLLEVSGISAIAKDNSYGTPEGVCLVQEKKLLDGSCTPSIILTPVQDNTIRKKIESNSTQQKFADVSLSKSQVPSAGKEISKTETPTNNVNLIRKTSSLEKIINRFKKVRANILPSAEKNDEFRTIVEEKENTVNMEMFTAKRILLPDLLSPSYNVLTNVENSTDYADSMRLDDDEVVKRKPRESLGAALGVDHTFLDQFDLID